MGVPKFFRYTSERYPCLNELVKQYQIPDFDNMYLDMNGIIHNCSHPDDSNPHFRITEEKIFQDIFHYLTILFQIIKPKKLFFMAIDGVAPRAKMNQQRGRRFRSAREAEKLEEEAKAKGETLPSEKRFDSNCITPGTAFMVHLHEQLKYFVKHKMSTDPLWSKVKVILSGHETPGEGEHKIMDYIRWQRSQPDYEPNTRHCLYGLDADLIMLGMCTHEPHFALLREEVKFGKTTQRATSPEETNFYLLHLSLMREYLQQEFIEIKDKLPFPYDLEKIVDDWVLMGFLVGNDFIPNLPNMHISNDALPLLYKTYMAVLPTLDGYINEAGDLNLARFEIFMQELAKIDKEKFQDTYADLKYFEAKTGRRPNANERREYKPNNDDTFNVNVEDIKANKPDDELQSLINATQEMFFDDVDNEAEEYEETSDEEATFEMEFILHKKDYYMNKLDYSSVTDDVLADQAEGYVRAIQWNLLYYYKGCPSWCWYYPHHYAPYISDIKGFKDLKIEFELGEPFKPFEQLLAVLPAASRQLLPAPFHALMTDEDSPIVHYYPVNFETDLNGKKNDWEAVVLIPFIDEVNLLSAMAPCYQRLTEDELKRNTHGPMLVYNWTPENLGNVPAPKYFPPILECHAKEQPVYRQELDVPAGTLKRGMLPNASRDLLFPGFPTMRHLKYQTTLKKCKVKVFDQPSRNENMIVRLAPGPEPPLETAARDLLGKVVWVGWPHLTKAKVISVSNEKMRLHHVDKQNTDVNGEAIYATEQNVGNLHRQWISERSTVIDHNMNRLGIELGDVNIIVHAVNLKGYKYLIQDNTMMVLEPEWCAIPCGYAYQAVLPALSEHVMPHAGRLATPQEAYPPGDKVFLLTAGQYYGCMAEVVDSSTIRSGRIKVSVRDAPQPAPAPPPARRDYRAAHHAAAACGISAQFLSRITGAILVVLGEKNDLPTESQNKINLGLNLKFNKKNQEVSGYTRRCGVSNMWLYSQRCIELVRSYSRQFPELFDRLARSCGNDVFFEGELWPREIGQKKPQEVQAWLKAQPHSTAARRECGSEALEPEEMKALAESLDKQIQELKGMEKKVTLHVKWNLLYKPELHEGNLQPDPKADFKLYDRVVCVARNITAPLGAAGTVTAVHRPPASNTVRLADRLNAEPTYQVMFDEPFPGAVAEPLFDETRFYRMLPTNMLSLSYGRKLRSAAGGAHETQQSAHGTPNLLRRNDGHHSAFASYSPTRDQKTPVSEVRSDSTDAQPSNPQDNATQLLRSLLNISQGEADSNKKPANKKASDQNRNWRSRNDNSMPLPPPPPNRGQPENWRNSGAPRPPQPAPAQDWASRHYKNPPLLPLPAWEARGPAAARVPPPAFAPRAPPPALALAPRWPTPNSMPHQNAGPHPGPIHQSAAPYPGSMPHQNAMPHQNSLPPQNYMPHPNLAPIPNSMAHQNWMPYQNSVPHHNTAPQQPALDAHGAEKANPFVPLQVQTSQRRTQPAANTQRAPAGPPAPRPAPARAPPADRAMPQQHDNASKRPQRKKKPRVAANLPFQMD